jgi:hypothetical protein
VLHPNTECIEYVFEYLGWWVSRQQMPPRYSKLRSFASKCRRYGVDQRFYPGRVVKFAGMARHGTRRSYKEGCRCDACRAAQAAYQARYRDRVLHGLTRPTPSSPPPIAPLPATAGPCEVAVLAELAGLPAATEQPALAAAAVALGQVLDGRPPAPKPGAAKVLVAVMDSLHKASARHGGGGLRAVRELSASSHPPSR